MSLAILQEIDRHRVGEGLRRDIGGRRRRRRREARLRDHGSLQYAACPRHRDGRLKIGRAESTCTDRSSSEKPVRQVASQRVGRANHGFLRWRRTLSAWQSDTALSLRWDPSIWLVGTHRCCWNGPQESAKKENSQVVGHQCSLPRPQPRGSQ